MVSHTICYSDGPHFMTPSLLFAYLAMVHGYPKIPTSQIRMATVLYALGPHIRIGDPWRCASLGSISRTNRNRGLCSAIVSGRSSP